MSFIKSLQTVLFVSTEVSASLTAESETKEVRLAAATLLLEVSRSDGEIHQDELEEITRSLANFFSLDDQSLANLLHEAQNKSASLTSYYELTSKLNKQLGHDQKMGIIELAWRVALCDDRLDSYENHLIRKVASLMYVERHDIVRAKQRAQDSLASQTPNQTKELE